MLGVQLMPWGTVHALGYQYCRVTRAGGFGVLLPGGQELGMLTGHMGQFSLTVAL